ncbi:putative transmembrane protein [Toxoplasma gondii TgCatPRC2]|uniref:Putative transmembrane protein n=1 Tax=Toxoplasma gondii TgCatPRC2 TaxID=1130821 RepID=A0A151H4U4_TOXGO|nr:putative transmembrane protein [Toxoplasma gondii TgCatPRC2]
MPIQMEKCVWVAKRPPGRATFCHWKERLCWKMGLLRSQTRNLLFLALTCLSATSGVFAIPQTTPRWSARPSATHRQRIWIQSGHRIYSTIDRFGIKDPGVTT